MVSNRFILFKFEFDLLEELTFKISSILAKAIDLDGASLSNAPD